ncbi:helix-turn-helix domain-containing protein [Asanoa sp. NPDC050611]|uniref:helix-turn-helix domain-containing protein n=1 Tax=Asanoa sp. NPDC050611 TaxID=3157098 RepID=UPI0033FD78BC
MLDTADIPRQDRIDTVYSAMMQASAPSYVVHEDADGEVHTRIEFWELGDASVFTVRSTGIRLLRTPKLAKEDAAPVVALSVQRLAAGRHEQLGHRQVVRPGALMMVDLSAPYDFSWSGTGAAGCLQIPIDDVGLPIDVIRRAAVNLRASPLYGAVTSHVAQLVREPRRLSTHSAADMFGRASTELARALLASAAPAEPHARAVLAETLLARVRLYVRQHLADPELSPAAIAAAHHISVRYLYRICADADLRLEQWIISERLRRAREELLRPESQQLTIANIARRWGFRDPSHFARRFHRMYGVTPTELRRDRATASK